MSIIADTLNRLQARTPNLESRQPDLSDGAAFHQNGGPASHDKPRPSRHVLIVIFGLILGIGSIGLAGFWIGWNADLGLSALSSSPQVTKPASPATVASAPLPGLTQSPPALPPIGPSDALTDSIIPPINVNFPDSSIESAKPEQLETSVHAIQVPPLNRETASSHQPETSDTSQSTRLSKEANTTPKPSGDHSSAQPLTTTVLPKTAPKPTHTNEVVSQTRAIDLSTDSETSTLMMEPSIALPVTKKNGASTEPLTIPLEEEAFLENPMVTQETDIEAPLFPHQVPEPLSQGVSTAHQVIPTFTSAPPVQPRNVLRQGQHLIQAGKYEEALSILSPLFDNSPTEWEPWFWMGTAYLGKGDLEQADQYFLSGLARNDKVPQMWIQRALVAQQRGEYQLAIHELRQAESLQPDLPHIHLNMGYAYDQLGNERLANQYYGKFMQLTEGNPEFFSTRKKLLARLTQGSSPKSSPIR